MIKLLQCFRNIYSVLMSQANIHKTEDKYKKSLSVVVYEPESRIKHPVRLIKQMWYDLLASRELAWQLF